ncbi:MAG TPA: acyl-CoA dehydrogenase family protein [Acetobacteraceae bacterium]|jgi:alkylation response protein AidB-like acyl-CoA dehydrogenase|nr:acyl-CoA dehydrogenase family protein [Acetobacteraceae bacterium]
MQITFPPPPPCPEAETLRAEVREFLARELAGRTPRQRAESWNGYDRDFSRKLGQRGWIGMTWPKQYGGHERSALERYVVLEELLAAGAPVNMHWIADRQSGPLLLRAGTEAQRQAVLPRIAAGECGFCIGMSEPDSGSDLASVRTRAAPVQGGFLVNGTKLWTSGAHLADYMILFCRTGPGERHEGTSQLLVDLKHTKGISIRPVLALSGEHHFNEVVFTDAFLPEDSVIGALGQGWAQVTSELAYERSGPERFLSTFQVVVELTRALGSAPSERGAIALGRLAAHIIALRRMSRSVAGMLQQGGNPALEAALVKEVGNTLEQEIPEIVRLLLDVEPEADGADQLAAVLGHTMLHIPSFSLRGGTREVLRGIIARGLGLR